MANTVNDAPAEVMTPVWDALFDTNACPSRQRGHFAAKVALDAIPDGWAKIDGEWVQLREGEGHFTCSYGDDCCDGRHYIDGEWKNFGVYERCWITDHNGSSSDTPENSPQGQL